MLLLVVLLLVVMLMGRRRASIGHLGGASCQPLVACLSRVWCVPVNRLSRACRLPARACQPPVAASMLAFCVTRRGQYRGRDPGGAVEAARAGFLPVRLP